MWIGPEHLKNYMNMDASYSSQKGDVYSFAIILQEVITRSEPFENNHMDTDGEL